MAQVRHRVAVSASRHLRVTIPTADLPHGRGIPLTLTPAASANDQRSNRPLIRLRQTPASRSDCPSEARPGLHRRSPNRRQCCSVLAPDRTPIAPPMLLRACGRRRLGGNPRGARVLHCVAVPARRKRRFGCLRLQPATVLRAPEGE
jgi:hypothetical protein